MDLLVYAIVRSSFFAMNLLPFRMRLIIVTCFIRIIRNFSSRYNKTSLRNMRIVFPDRDQAFYKDMLKRSDSSLARLIVDFGRLPSLTKEWVERSVNIPFSDRYRELKQNHPRRGTLLVTGHLGSFELYAYSLALLNMPLSFIVRNFQLPRLDRWWNGIRECNGNEVISRKGAYLKMSKNLSEGKTVAILFDQNVTRNRAVFINWFGVPAATTKAVAMAVLRNRPNVMVTALVPRGENSYEALYAELNFDAICEDDTIVEEEKIRRITEEVVREYEEIVLQYPEGWFWMHRRWKTRPIESEEGSFYE